MAIKRPEPTDQTLRPLRLDEGYDSPRTADVRGRIQLPEGMEMVMPGDNVNPRVQLIAPMAIEEGLRFAIREGGLTVGAGAVTRILDKAIRYPGCLLTIPFYSLFSKRGRRTDIAPAGLRHRRLYPFSLYDCL